MSVVDKVIGVFNPQAALKRAVARQNLTAFNNVSLDYNAASRGRRTSSWRANGSGAISEVSKARNRVRFIGRDMVRNNPIAARVPKVMGQNIIGSGIIPNTVSSDDKTKDRVEGLIKDHFDSPACDFNGQLDLYGLQALMTEITVVDGECFCIKHMMPNLNEGVLPLQLQVLEADYLDTSKQTVGTTVGTSRVVNGIQFDSRGKIEGYWFYQEHPGDVLFGRMNVSTFYPVERVAHMFRLDRPGQINGISWFAPVAVKVADMHDFSDARLYREKIAGAFTAFVHRNMDEDIPGLTGKKSAGNSLSNYPLEEIEPGMIEHLDHGDQITFGTPPQVDGYKEFWSAQALEISMGLGISYAALTGDMSLGNFSSNRLGWLEDQRFFSAQRAGMINGKLLHPLTRWMKQSINAVQLMRPFDFNWTAPARDSYDPYKEMKTNIEAVDAGFMSETEVIRGRGRDEQDVHAERLADAVRKSELGKLNKETKDGKSAD